MHSSSAQSPRTRGRLLGHRTLVLACILLSGTLPRSVPAQATERVGAAWRLAPAQADSAAIREAIEARARELLQGALADGAALAEVRIDSVAVGDSIAVWFARDPGPPVGVGGVFFLGPHRTRESFLRRVIGFVPGEPFRIEDAILGREALGDTDLYERVEGPFILSPPGLTNIERPAPDIGGAGQADRQPVAVDVLYELAARPVNRLTGILGYSGEEERVFGYVDLALGNLFGTGRAAELRWQGQQDLETAFYVSWHEPYLLRWPLSLDARLNHVIQDTLYAETTYGVDLGWSPARRWVLGAGWDWNRLVIGGDDGQHIRRQTARFTLERRAPAWYRIRQGWAGRVAVSTTTGWRTDVRRGQWTGRAWFGRGRVGAWLTQEAGVVAGADSLLRVDTFALGGAGSLRGVFEGAFRTQRHVLLRNEVGLRPDNLAGARFYVLADVAWMRRWSPTTGTQFGTATGETWTHALGFGLEVPTRAGDVSLDYAVPKGGSLAQGRVHFHLTSRF